MLLHVQVICSFFNAKKNDVVWIKPQFAHTFISLRIFGLFSVLHYGKKTVINIAYMLFCKYMLSFLLGEYF